MMRTLRNNQAGFTLIEMIVVIVIVGILATIGGNFIVHPIKGYLDLSRRTRLVDQAEMALRRMQRDVRQALPNSVRVAASGNYLELLHTIDGGRYRRYQGVATDDILDFTTAENGFDVLGDLRAAPAAGTSLVVYNVSASGASGNAYWGTPDNLATVGAGSTVSHVTISPPFPFTNASPVQRFFLVDEPVTYACEGGVLNRYAGYGLSASQPTPPGGTSALVTENVAGCQFNYQPGTSQRAGLVTLNLTLTEQGESITLLHQIHVVNAP